MNKYEYMTNTFKSELKPRARLVLNCLALHSNKEMTCFPSIKRIAKECGYSVSTVKRALNDLEELGYIEKIERYDERKNGGQTSNLYVLKVVDEKEYSLSEKVVNKESHNMKVESKKTKINRGIKMFDYANQDIKKLCAVRNVLNKNNYVVCNNKLNLKYITISYFLGFNSS